MPSDDNVQVGLGDTGGAMIATEFLGSKHYQIVKIAHGDHNEVALVEDGTGTGGRPLPVRLFGNDSGTGLDIRTIGSTTALEMNILGSVGATAIGVEIKNTGDVQGITGTITVTSGSGLAYWGITGGDTITIRGLSAGPTSGVAPSSSYDYVSVQGTTQGFPVRSTLWAQHGRTAVGISGDGTLKNYVTNTVGVTIDSGGMGITTHAGALKVIQGVSAGGGGWGITTNGKRIDVKTRTGNYLGIRGLSAGATHGGSLLGGTTVDSVAVQGMTQGFPVRSTLVGGTGPYKSVGMSGDALKVAIASAGITINVDVTDTVFMVGGNSAGGKYVGHAVRVVGASGANVLSTVVGSLTAGDPAVRVVGPSGAALIVAGSPGATAIGVTIGVPVFVKSTDLDIRGLTAGPTFGTYNSLYDYVSVQGTTQGYPIRSTLWAQHGRTAIGISGDGTLKSYVTNSSLTVDGTGLGITGTVTITSGSGLSYYGITGGDTITIRGLTAGPTSGAAMPTTAYDYISVQGFTQGFPVRSTLVGGTGPYKAVGMSGDALKVAVASAGITINVDVTDTTFMMQGLSAGGAYTGHAVRVVGASGGSIAVHPAGNTLTGITIGVPVFVKSTDLDIRGLTFGSGKRDFVGVTGGAYTELVSQGITLESIGSTLSAMYPVDDGYGLARQQTADNIWTNINTNITAPLATNTTVSYIAAGMSGAGGNGINTAESVVRVVHTDQPVSIVNGQKGLGTSAVQMSSSTTILKSGVNIKSHQQNSGKIYIGGSNSVTTNTEANGGYPLSAGEEMFIECKSPNMIYVIGDATGLTACFVSS